jgi:hypothetical protein
LSTTAASPRRRAKKAQTSTQLKEIPFEIPFDSHSTLLLASPFATLDATDFSLFI